MDTKKKVYEIIDGPNRELVFDIFKYSPGNEISLDFNFKIKYYKNEEHLNLKVLFIKSLAYVDCKKTNNFGYEFEIIGFCQSIYMPCRRFKATYSVKTRKGTIIMLDDE